MTVFFCAKRVHKYGKAACQFLLYLEYAYEVLTYYDESCIYVPYNTMFAILMTFKSSDSNQKWLHFKVRY